MKKSSSSKVDRRKFLTGVAVTGAAAVTSGAATGAVLKNPQTPAHDAPAERGLWKVLYNKYYVDELYDRYIVQPLVGFSRVVLWRSVDQGVIDGAGVNGAANLSRALGWIGSRIQTGQVGLYVVLFVVGAVYVLGMVAW